MTMPSMLTLTTHSQSSGSESSVPVNSVRAGIGATSPLETIEAAEDAVVC
jgi:hypothetical protein